MIPGVRTKRDNKYKVAHFVTCTFAYNTSSRSIRSLALNWAQSRRRIVFKLGFNRSCVASRSVFDFSLKSLSVTVGLLSSSDCSGK